MAASPESVSQKDRHAFRRDLAKAVKTAVRGSAWKSRQGAPFRASEGWFVTVLPYVHFDRQATAGWVTIKPMAADDAFWTIIGHPELEKQPLSFRADGGLVCRPPWIAQVDVDGDPDPVAAANGLIALAEQQLGLATRMSAHDFVDFCRSRATVGRSYLVPILATLVGAGLFDEAKAECRKALAANHSGGFFKDGKSIVDLTVEYLDRRAASP